MCKLCASSLFFLSWNGAREEDDGWVDGSGAEHDEPNQGGQRECAGCLKGGTASTAESLESWRINQANTMTPNQWRGRGVARRSREVRETYRRYHLGSSVDTGDTYLCNYVIMRLVDQIHRRQFV